MLVHHIELKQIFRFFLIENELEIWHAGAPHRTKANFPFFKN